MPRYIKFSLLLTGLILVSIASNINWGKDRWKNIIAYDGKGYYDYLPATFIYHNPTFSFFKDIQNKYYTQQEYFDYCNYVDGKRVNKYFAGTAIAELPFFLIAHCYAKIARYDSDGYSFPYQVAINLAAIFYCIAGLYFLAKWLIKKNKNPKLVLFSLLTFLFGSHLFYYTISEPSLSHVYSFAVVTFFIYTSDSFFKTLKNKYFVLSVLLLGWIILLRPINGLILFSLPFLAGSKESFLSGVKQLLQKRGILFASISGFFMLLFIQLVAYKIETGHWLLYAYGSDEINFFHPHIIKILFSYKKGLFIYTPLMLFAMLGLIKLVKESKWQSYSLAGFLLLIIYALSCWKIWWYGGSFSGRPFVEYIPFFIFLLAELYTLLQKRISLLLFHSTILFLVLLCQVQTYQYRYNVIHWEKMDKEHYWNAFLRIDLLAKHENPNKDLLDQK